MFARDFTPRFGAAPSADEMVRGGTIIPDVPGVDFSVPSVSVPQAMDKVAVAMLTKPVEPCPQGIPWWMVLVGFGIGLLLKR